MAAQKGKNRLKERGSGGEVYGAARANDQPLSKVMPRLNNSYSKYFNAKHDRIGHVFQSRCRSKHISDEEYLLTVLKYIHVIQ